MSLKTNLQKISESPAAKTGKKASRSSCPSEHVEHRNYVSQFKKRYPGVMIFSVPNGGKRGKVTAHKLALEGLLPGVPDLFIPEWRLWVEMKRQKGGRLSHAQKEVIPELERIGYTVLVGYGCNHALELTDSFLAQNDISQPGRQQISYPTR